jgi:hypothetical protein
MESGTNGAATINGSSRKNLGNLGCWGGGGWVVAEDALWSRNYFGVNAEIAVRGCHDSVRGTIFAVIERSDFDARDRVFRLEKQ